MASIIKMNGRYRATVSVNRVRKSRTFDTRAAARAWGNRTEVEGNLGSRHTLEDCFRRYAKEVSPEHKGHRWEIIRLNKLCGDKIAFVRLCDLEARHIADWRDARLKEVSKDSVNREWNLISQVINWAIKDQGWLTINPLTQVRRPKRGQPRSRVITDDEAAAITENCRNREFAIFFQFALETGMRRGEIAAIRPENVQGRVVVLPDSKSGVARTVPLSKRALELLEMVDYRFKISKDNITKTFKRVCDEQGIEGAHFHDTRHTALTRIAGKVHILDLMRISGHKDTKMLNIYYNPDPEEIANLLD